MITQPQAIDVVAAQPDFAQAEELVDRLERSKSRTDKMVIVALRAGLRPGSSRFGSAAAEAAVGDQYAVSGRVRSQAIARVRRRAVEMRLVLDGNPFLDMRLTELGFAVAARLSKGT